MRPIQWTMHEMRSSGFLPKPLSVSVPVVTEIRFANNRINVKDYHFEPPPSNAPVGTTISQTHLKRHL